MKKIPMRILLITMLVTLPLLLTACSSPRTKRGVQMSDSDVRRELLQVANSVEKSLHTLAATQESTSPPLVNTTPLTTPEGGMGGKADIDWTGPIAPFINKIAEMTNYRVKVLGTEPAIPIIVSITAKNAVIADILQNASLQAGKRATLVISPQNRLIELRYLQN